MDRPTGFTHPLVHHVIEARAAERPNAVAIVDALGRLRYDEMNRMANRVAHRLRAAGAGADTPVGVLMPRGRELVVAALGVLKAGACYVPLDPNHPPERLRFMRADSRAHLLLGVPALAAACGLAAEDEIIDTNPALVDTSMPATNPGQAINPESLSYVFYTSGSTGWPKAVGVRHAGTAAFVASALGTFEPEDLAGVLFGASVCFDLSIFEMFVPLAAGGTVIVGRTVLDLPELSARERITLMSAVPPAMSELLRQDVFPDSLRVVNLGGEAVPNAMCRQVRAQTTAQRLYNLYGPTECTTWCTIARIAPDEPGAYAPIGPAIEATNCYLLDPEGHPVPDGGEGELFVGGVGLARGYLGRPGLTAERFVPDPFTTLPGQRMYRTGDRVSRRADGQYLYHGRFDFQVKLNGLRIELAEIESVIEEDPRFPRAIVLLLGELPAERRLVAFYERPAAGTVVDLAAERERLRRRLPDYMLPAAWVAVDRFPLMLNGKVDRHAVARLPIEAAAPGTCAPWQAPQGPLEEALAKLWAELLQPPPARVGRDDSFFALGGNSIGATRMLVRVEREHGVELALRTLFDEPTLAAFARAVGAGLACPRTTAARLQARGLSEAPLSRQQEMLVLEDELHPATSCYNIVQSFRLRGKLDEAVLARSLDALVARHDALRTRFVRRADGLVQQVVPAALVSVPLVRLDMTGLAEPAQRESRLREAMVAVLRAHFPLAAAPLARAVLARCADNEHVLGLAIHHVATDGWSQSVLLRELGALVQAGGDASVLGPAPLSCTDYGAWQHTWLDDARLHAGLAWWSARLEGAPPETVFPADRSRPLNRAFRGAREPVRIEAALARDVRALGARCGATVFMTLLAGFKLLLHRYTGQDDLVIGTAFADRREIETEAMVGDFVNTVVLRTDLSGRPRIEELLRRVAATTVEAHAWRHVPFQSLVRQLHSGRALDRNPLCQTMFVMQDAPAGALDLGPALDVREEPLDIGTSLIDLAFSMEEAGDAFEGHVEYDTDLYDRATICGLIAAWRTLLAGMARAPAGFVDEVPMVDSAEAARLATFARGPVPEAVAEDVVARFERQVRASPRALAVVAEDHTLSYAELLAQARALAARLRGAGVGAESRVGVMLERSPALVVAQLAVLMAGGATVPLDPRHPAERLAALAGDASLDGLLLDSRTRAAAPRGAHWTLDLDLEAAAPPTGDLIHAAVDPAQLACVFYTSGTTGRPNGVGVPRGALARQLDWVVGAFGLVPADRFLHKASIGFDASIAEILAPLLAGAAVVLARPHGEYDPGYLAELIAREHVSCIDLPPSLLQALVDVLEPQAWSQVRLIASGGEALRPELARLVHARLPECRLLNTYGPTETTVQSAWTEVSAGLEGGPLGRPITGTRLHVLDAQGVELPVGATGELYIGGEGVTRGYLGRPALTATRFLPNPFGAPGERLYRTGDRVRWGADGRLHFLGRVDRQVKLRGFRIEPAEIEQAILREARIGQALVLVREDDAGRPELVAYLVPAAGLAPASLPSPAECRDALRGRLPAYMLPVRWMTLAALPLTRNGKIDRARLPRPDGSTLATRVHEAPRDDVEATICTLFAELLQCARVGRDDDFFELGGHSLLATRAAARLGEHFGIALRARSLFAASTPATLAESVRMLQSRQGIAMPAAADAEDQVMLRGIETMSEDEVALLLDLLGDQA